MEIIDIIKGGGGGIYPRSSRYYLKELAWVLKHITFYYVWSLII